MDIVKATEQYEDWLRGFIPLIDSDLKQKHAEMAADAFAFFRATVYRWVQLWDKHAGEEGVPSVLAVGDLHLENFGTWRDREGRLVWGLNDFDEATVLPYTADLIRHATSVHLAIHETDALAASFDRACESILAGYSEVIDRFLADGRASIEPIVLAEKYGWLERIAMDQAGAPGRFWHKVDDCEKLHASEIPADVTGYVADLMPEPDLEIHWRHRQAGLGSLGRQRYVGVARWEGGMVAREAKALAPSSWLWHAPNPAAPFTRYNEILDRAVRCPDPYFRQQDKWIVRRLAPDCIKLRLDHLPKTFEYEILNAMGREIGNVHAGSPDSLDAIAKDMRSRPHDWLEKISTQMSDHIRDDWKEWRDSEHSAGTHG
ncbi:MAG: DUF2252 family protein [Capsulimonadaceae bacterium]